MIRVVLTQDVLEYLKDKEGFVYNFMAPEQSFYLPSREVEEIEDEEEGMKKIVELVSSGKKVYVPFAHLFMNNPDNTPNERFLNLILTNYSAFTKGDLILVTNVKQIPREVEQYVILEEDPPPSREEIKKTIKEVFESFYGRKPEPSEEKNMERISERLVGLTKSEVRNSVLQSLEKFSKINEEFLAKQKLMHLKKRTSLEYEEPKVTLDDIGGNENIKKYFMALKKIMNEEAKRFGIKPPKGLLILGPQGTAKSTLPKALANYLGIPLVKFNIGALMSKYYGETENRVYRVLKTIDAMGRCVVHIDEIDKVLKNSSDSHEATARIGGMLMEWMAEKETYTPVIMTGNYIEKIDTDFTRAGRVDTIFWTWFPKKEERMEIWKIHLRKTGWDPKNFDLETLAEESRFFTGSEIETAVQLALRSAFVRGEELTTERIVETMKRMIVPVWFKEKEKFTKLFESLRKFIPASSMKNSDTIPSQYSKPKVSI